MVKENIKRFLINNGKGIHSYNKKVENFQKQIQMFLSRMNREDIV